MKKYLAIFLALTLCVLMCACQPADTTTTGDTQPSQTTSTEEIARDSALHQAKLYLSVMNYSYQGLIDQLVSEGFTQEEATYAADNCAANWTQQAVDCANAHILNGSFSRGALYNQLVFEGYTEEQVRMAIEGCEANWNQEALQALQAYLQIAQFSKTGMYDQLMFEDFTEDEINYALESCNVDWAEQALLRAKALKEGGTTADMLEKTLINEGYTQSEAAYAAANA